MGALTTIIREPGASLRLGLRVAAMALLLAIILPAHFWCERRQRHSPWPRRYLAATSHILGLRVAPVGTALAHDVFFVANHVGWVDIPIMAGLTGTAFIAQDQIAGWPVIGWLARLNHTIFVSRTETREVARQVAGLREALARDGAVTLFPEGTTTDGRRMLPFKPSLFAVLAPPPRRLMVQPVALCFDDRGRDLAWIGTETAPESGWRIFSRPWSHTIICTVRFLEPFDPAACADRKLVSATARARIADALEAHYGHPLLPVALPAAPAERPEPS